MEPVGGDAAARPARGADGPRGPGPGARVWYAAYASNMCLDRFTCYLAGGRPPGAARTYPGCRDARPPERAVPLLLPGQLYFALESAVWTGGCGFYDPLEPGEILEPAPTWSRPGSSRTSSPRSRPARPGPTST